MQVAVNESGEIVIPKEVAEAAGFAPGCEVELVSQAGEVRVESYLPVRIEFRDGLPVLIPLVPVPPLTVEDVEAIRQQIYEERFRSLTQ